MKAIQFSQFGSADVLQLVDMEAPVIDQHQVLVKVKAAGINPIDCKIRQGTSFVSSLLKDCLPSGLGYEFSGVIEEMGEGVEHFKIGDAVMGFAGFPRNPQCYAEYIIADTSQMILKPESVSFEQAAALPLVGLTALQALKLADIKSNQKVLVLAGAGGVGHLAIQLAKQRGAYVMTTASPSNHLYLTKLGADQCVDYHQPLEDVIKEPVDVVIDLVGGKAGIEALDFVKKDGCFVTLPTITAKEVIASAEQQNKKAIGMVMAPNMEQLQKLAALHNKQQLQVSISQIYALEQAKAAHEQIQSGHTKGKIVFVMG